ncbi:hypothetical protein FHW36_10517 [Chitinophaga polysaccharea]|uniref:Uncharacterized protein n=1 Tax=Chitinophaga polysaccharea TaxID=1293035 RepID=A0A561PNB3_9BACT|nr:hypothetical protein FHW36_10517 [Chitinophaga polysaccharea]
MKKLKPKHGGKRRIDDGLLPSGICSPDGQSYAVEHMFLSCPHHLFSRTPRDSTMLIRVPMLVFARLVLPNISLFLTLTHLPSLETRTTHILFIQ